MALVLAFVGVACRNRPVDSVEPTTESTDPCTWGEGGEAIARTMDGVDSDGDGFGETSVVTELPQARLEGGYAGGERALDVDDFSGDGVPDVATWSAVTQEQDGVKVGRQAVHIYEGPFNASMCDVGHNRATLIELESDSYKTVLSAGDVNGDS